MPRWADLPRERLLVDISLWSADLANLAGGIALVSAFADSFHLDVSDAHFATGLLFFPDLVRALRPHSARPFHVHLMVEHPTALVDDFVAAGADVLTVHAEVGEQEASAAIAMIRRAGCEAGLALRCDTPVPAIAPYLESVDAVLLLGTEVGVKGQPLSPAACGRVEEAARLIRERGARARVVADGGIRFRTVPLLRRAGADVIVPGSLVFESADLAETFRWLRGLPESGQ